ncbi:MAG: hypothetical protein A3F72_14565 [Bacteroidetes bacterium RIFCSPLOWO2_12_FULL_35_15]|nr:MAG: hypothetical protein A3F72_14565 [Bacteroidetes bacterium RIFCSPLOWO2_12_FULL_35_15]
MITIKKSDEKILNILPEGILIFEIESNQILFANEYMCNVIGYSPDDFIQFSLFDLHPIETTKNTVHQYSELLNKEIDTVNLIPVISKGKKIIYFDVAGKKINYKEKKCFLGTFRNSTPIFEKKGKIRSLLTNLSDIKKALDQSAIIAITDSNGIILEANDKFCSLSKYSLPELVGQSHRIVNSGFHPKSFFADLWKCISSGKVWNGEICNKAKDGSIYWVDTTITPFLDSTGKPEQYISIRYDITSRKRSEEQLIIAEGIAHIGSFDVLVKENKHFWSQEMYKILEFDPKTTNASVENFINLIHPDDLELVNPASKADGTNTFDDTLIFRLVMKNGSTKFIKRNGITQFDTNGAPTRFLGTFQDITESLKIENEKKRISEQLKAAEKISNTGSWEFTLKDNTVFWSDGIYKILEFDPETVKPSFEKFLSKVHPDDLEVLETSHNNKATTKLKDISVIRFLMDDGRTKNIKRNGMAFYDDHNNFVRSIGTLQDITVQHEIENKLIKSEELFRLITENTNDWICLNKLDGTIIYSSPSSITITGYEPEELIGKNRAEFFHAEDFNQVKKYLFKKETPKEFWNKLEYRFVKKDGTIVWLETSGKAIHDEQGKVIQFCTATRDISDRKRIREQLITAEKIAKVGSFECLVKEGKFFWSQEMYEILELNPENTEPSFEKILSLVNSDDLEIVKISHNNKETNNFNETIVFRLQMKNGSTKFIRRNGIAQFDTNGAPTRLLGTFQDITELHLTQLKLSQLNNDLEELLKKRTENYLEEKWERVNIEKKKKQVDSNYKMLFEQIPLGVLVLKYDGSRKDFVFKDINTTACKMERTTKNEIINKTIPEFYPYSKNTGILNLLKDVYETGKTVITPPRHFKHEQTEAWRELFMFKLITNEIVVVFKDVTEKHFAEQALKNSLVEKEILLNEVHHRVKNNLQIIIGLMQMQSAVFKDVPLMNDFLLQSGNRIKAMGLIHETIYQTGQYSGINIVSYIKSLYTYLCNAIGKPQIDFKIESEINEISINNASAFGIVLNEIISNSLKYAFPKNAKGEISVSIKRNKKETILITIKDNGVGVKSIQENSKGLGLELIFGLIKQIKGEVKIETFPSFKYSIKIPIEKIIQN